MELSTAGHFAQLSALTQSDPDAAAAGVIERLRDGTTSIASLVRPVTATVLRAVWGLSYLDCCCACVVCTAHSYKRCVLLHNCGTQAWHRSRLTSEVTLHAAMTHTQASRQRAVESHAANNDQSMMQVDSLGSMLSSDDASRVRGIVLLAQVRW